MKILSGIHELPKLETAYVTIGNFDGIHLGHQKIIQQLKKDSKLFPKIALTFRESPFNIMFPDKFMGYITPPAIKQKILNSMGFDYLVCQDFHLVKDIPAETYLELLNNKIKNIQLYIGYNFKFGKGNEGDADFIKRAGPEKNIDPNIIPKVRVDDITVSSTAIRHLIMDGSMQVAGRLLGRPFFLYSHKVKGDRIGRTIGFPTLNLASNNQVLPQKGVYSTLFYYKRKFLPAMSYIGTRPTVHGHEPRIETNILNFNEHIPEGNYYLLFIDKIREEKRLQNLEELTKVLYNDMRLVSNQCKSYALASEVKQLFSEYLDK